MVHIPIIARIDGRAFHTYTKFMNKPFDMPLHEAMLDTASYLLTKSNPVIAYTQSDEISLIFLAEDYKSDVFFSGKVYKMQSVLASMATRAFQYPGARYLPEFDCRVFNVPNKEEAINYLIWREQDAVRNSIQALGQAYFSHKQLHGLNMNLVKQKLLEEKNVSWEALYPKIKNGTYIRRAANSTRTGTEYCNFPILTTIDNRVDVIFNRAEPVLKSVL